MAGVETQGARVNCLRRTLQACTTGKLHQRTYSVLTRSVEVVSKEVYQRVFDVAPPPTAGVVLSSHHLQPCKKSILLKDERADSFCCFAET